MSKNQLNRGEERSVMYIENKDGDIDGVAARIGWVTYTNSGRGIYYRGKRLLRAKGGGVKGNYFDEKTGEEYWVSRIKKRGSNTHWAEATQVEVDEDAKSTYLKLKGRGT